MFYCFYNPPSFDMDYGIFNVHTDVNARHCTRVCTGTVRESALKIDFRIKNLLHAALVNRICVADMPVRCSIN